MKLGLYWQADLETAGGAFVVRDDLVRAAEHLRGRHQIDILNRGNSRLGTGPLAALRTATRNKNWTRRIKQRLKASQNSAAIRRLREEAEDNKVQAIWFNHSVPIDIGLPYILSVFDVQHRLQPWFPEVSSHGVWEERESVWVPAIRRASFVTVPSEVAKENFKFLFNLPEGRIRVLPFPTPSSMLDAASNTPRAKSIRAKYRIADKYIFYPAQFWPHKNHVNLLHALKILNRERNLSVDLVLTGSDHGNLTYVRDTVRNLELQQYVHFLGFVPREELVHLYREAYALVFVSFFGPENLPPLEAQALGCPVVLADIPGIKELYGDGPILVDPGNPQSIADGIELVASDPQCRENSIRRGRVLAHANTPQRYIEAIFHILDEFESVRRCWP